MNILTIDTSSPWDSFTLYAEGEGELLNKKFPPSDFRSEALIKEIEMGIKSLSFDMKDIDIIGVCIGPGSYTGTRIGVAAGMGIAQGLGIPLCGVNVLEILAYSQKNQEKTIFSFMESKNSEIYYGEYRFIKDKMVTIKDISKTSSKVFIDHINAFEGEKIIIGNSEQNLPFSTISFDNSLTKSHLMSRILSCNNTKIYEKALDLFYC